ncbi:cellulase family glycosylhydrolase [Ruminococcus sp. Marseille-P6503]|uniref:cellulase family glycosylhydrolase n=1 Tax=Ruminococcus sp. Marseille-P6503 TaxID=2364796 RepID=UPI000F541858|nr:cellulase family glycosylhydrolase [Ruminococcus sp. Marseille-P6503]
MVQTKTSYGRCAKVFAAVIFAVVICMGFFDFSKANAASSGFYVSGTSICDANGNAFVMRGVNIAHAWYSDKTEESIRGAADLGANTVRIVLSNGAQYSKTSSSEVQNIINMCKSNNVVCILEVHDATGSDNTYDLDRCVDYWIEMKNVLSGSEKYVIVNIANEWYGSWNGSPWAEGYKSAIQKLRNAGISNMLMVDSAGWGQYPDSIKDYGRSVFNADPDKNTVFSIHMYEYAGGTSSAVKSNIDNALGIGVPVVIGEFGAQHSNGDVDEASIMSYCTQKNVGYLGWSWKGNNSDLSYLDIANSWDGSSLSSWGNTLFNGTNGIKSTSKTCSVYSGSSGSGSSSSGSSGSSGTTTDQYGGVWGLDGTYCIKSVHSGKYLDVYYGKADNGTNIQQHSKNGTDAQKFKLVSDGNGYYTIFTAASGYRSCLDVYNWSRENGANINQWEYHGGDCQKFQFVKIGDAYAIKTKITDCYSCLDVYNWSTADGGNIAQWEYWGGNCQLWYLEPVSESSSSGSSSSGSESSGDSYTSLFWGESSAGAWQQAASVMTSKNGGSFNAADIRSNGYFYVEYSGTQNQVEFILQSWSGGAEWAKVQPSETGTANGHYYAKYSYDNCKAAFGSSDFSGKLDQIHAGAANSGITVYSVCYCYY